MPVSNLLQSLSDSHTPIAILYHDIIVWIFKFNKDKLPATRCPTCQKIIYYILCSQRKLLKQNKVWHNIDITVIFVTHDLDEAVYLSDRILALKANPGEVNEVIEVPVPRPRAPDMLLSPEFQATRRHIDELINPNRRAQKPDFKIINMVGTRNYL